jgi:hypothetical protein
MMMKSILAAAFILTATSAALAQAAGFNPGTVVGNVYESLYATYGYDFAFGYSPPPDGQVRPAPGHHHTVREKLSASPRLGNSTSAER